MSGFEINPSLTNNNPAQNPLLNEVYGGGATTGSPAAVGDGVVASIAQATQANPLYLEGLTAYINSLNNGVFDEALLKSSATSTGSNDAAALYKAQQSDASNPNGTAYDTAYKSVLQNNAAELGTALNYLDTYGILLANGQVESLAQAKQAYDSALQASTGTTAPTDKTSPTTVAPSPTDTTTLTSPTATTSTSTVDQLAQSLVQQSNPAELAKFAYYVDAQTGGNFVSALNTASPTDATALAAAYKQGQSQYSTEFASILQKSPSEVQAALQALGGISDGKGGNELQDAVTSYKTAASQPQQPGATAQGGFGSLLTPSNVIFGAIMIPQAIHGIKALPKVASGIWNLPGNVIKGAGKVADGLGNGAGKVKNFFSKSGDPLAETPTAPEVTTPAGVDPLAGAPAAPEVPPVTTAPATGESVGDLLGKVGSDLGNTVGDVANGNLGVDGALGQVGGTFGDIGVAIASDAGAVGANLGAAGTALEAGNVVAATPELLAAGTAVTEVVADAGIAVLAAIPEAAAAA